ncbi:MAG: hypothetical protein JW717_04345 [Marinilabiliaceae bacterium]|nr:hypothetical protein [Marinilabiliaceae bacterium]
MRSKRNVQSNLFFVLIVLIALALVPLLGEYIKNGGAIPDNFFDFPPINVSPKAGFNLTVFVVILLLVLFGILLYVYPWMFGFKKPINVTVKRSITRFPAWFWFGILLFIPTAILVWGKFSKPEIIIHYHVIPLFWGFSFIIDGIVYKRTGGDSLFKNSPRTLLGIGLASVSGWLLFEYLNFFIDDNWCYPAACLIGKTEFFIYAIIGSSGLMPMTIEVYTLLNTFKGLQKRYSNGPKVKISKKMKWVLLIASIGSIFFVSYYPNQLFFIIWFVPLVTVAVLLSLIGLWTPFTPIAEKGNWTPLALICMAQFFMGFIHESWNYLSGSHNPFFTNSPDYWIYSIPYVNVLTIFEMPLLGYFGYVPFGIYFWVWWLLTAYVLNTSPYFYKNSYSGND